MFRRSLFIQTQTTPNENALKFIPSGTRILPTQQTPTVEVTSIKDAIHKSELALKLLSINDKAISSILFGYDFITNNEVKPQNWNVLKPQIFALLTEHLTMGNTVLSNDFYDRLVEKSQSGFTGSKDEFDEDLTPEEEVVALIQELLTTRIQPAIQEDGGDIQYISFDHDKGIVYLRLIGACKSCSSSEITLKSGIEDMLKYYIDEVKAVEQVQDETFKKTEQKISDKHADTPKFEKHTVDDLPPAL
ncbi:hypothetical protein PICMEDRAFT_31278 [Pichia membranifaciens NRRL Y-2026]|uniref:Scaffold protein Nfu/NifU N-terminal domain-containing protein n=1 Tax=Pichia membranifaciens NRRL Y-2026 TaxID=763406 RepID=A0A1E3NQJ3_9ASCO|nr:hypothetical protein PICMEDRAFT_31278 [Pichia membranifaciens NRRL Y-2026]ODQ47978.1 hypothetical protein PICMEDRAFT_31278 [Pichia membranifaciens NRRL Y-2026]